MKDTNEKNSEEFDTLFELFGNETRRRIMTALWREFEFHRYVTESQDPIAFGDLRSLTGIRDSGNFNYHLNKLIGTLVDKNEEGYVLTPLGYKLMRSIDRLDEFEYQVRAEQPLEQPCPYCSGTLTAEYRRELLRVWCRDCDGLAAGGRFTSVEIPATATDDLSMDALLDRAAIELFSKLIRAQYGICWDCLGSVESDIVLCDAHEPGPDGACPNCDHRYRALVDLSCPSCGNAGQGPLREFAIIHSSTVAFFDRYDAAPDSLGAWRYRLLALGCATEHVVAAESSDTLFAFEYEHETHHVLVQEHEGGLVVEPAPSPEILPEELR